MAEEEQVAAGGASVADERIDLEEAGRLLAALKLLIKSEGWKYMDKKLKEDTKGKINELLEKPVEHATQFKQEFDKGRIQGTLYLLDFPGILIAELEGLIQAEEELREGRSDAGSEFDPRANDDGAYDLPADD